jgi:hypothetical protein
MADSPTTGGLSSTYGLACSVNFKWSWCPQLPPGRAPDLRVVLGELGPFAQHAASDYRMYAQRVSADQTEPPVVCVKRGTDGHFRIAYGDGAEFIIDANASEVFGVSRGALTLDDLVLYLQGPVLGFVLRLRGVTCLHSSATVVDDQALAVVGMAGMGKSTSAAAFARLGLPVLTDDVLALRDDGDSFHVQPGLPRVLLWPPSAEALFGAADALPRITNAWEKCYLDLTQPGYQFARRPAPLRAIYVLAERMDRAGRTEIQPLTGAEAVITLVANTYVNDFLDIRMRADEFELLGRLVRQVPVRRVRAPHDRGAVTQICEAILADFRALQEG